MTEKVMSPADIAILLHYHSWVGDWKSSSGNTLGESNEFSTGHPHGIFLADTAEKLVSLGLLVTPGKNRRFDPTEKLHAYVELLCQMPMPAQVWVHPDRVDRCGTAAPMLKNSTT